MERTAVAAAAAAAAAEGLGFAAGAAFGQQGFAVGELRRRQLAPPPPARPRLLVQAPADRLHLPHLLRRWRQLRGGDLSVEAGAITTPESAMTQKVDQY